MVTGLPCEIWKIALAGGAAGIVVCGLLFR